MHQSKYLEERLVWSNSKRGNITKDMCEFFFGYRCREVLANMKEINEITPYSKNLMFHLEYATW